jgi:hypothetical protein
VVADAREQTVSGQAVCVYVRGLSREGHVRGGNYRSTVVVSPVLGHVSSSAEASSARTEDEQDDEADDSDDEQDDATGMKVESRMR